MSKSRGFLPREGLYIDPVASAIKHTILQPLFILPLCVATLFPSIFHGAGFNYLSPDKVRDIAPFIRLLGIISIPVHLNEYLSRQVRNNWVQDPIWHGDWSNELVMVTGAAVAEGVGASIVKPLAKRGVKIVVVDINPMDYNPGPNVHYYQCDLSDSKAVARLCATLRTELGHPTVLINNAGIFRGRTVADGSYHDKDLTIRVNLLAPFFLMQECLPHMIEQNHGHIISISSMSAHIPPAGIADYGASKAGLLALHESVSLELAHKAPKIRLSLLIASFILTPMTQSFKSSVDKAPLLTPLMHVDTVGDAIVDTLYSGYGRDIYLPGMMRYLAGIRGWPMWLQCLMRSGTPRDLLDHEKSKVILKSRQQ